MFDSWQVIESIMPFLLQGLWMTVKVSLLALIFASIIGIIIGGIRSFANLWIVYMFGAYIHLLRGTPFLIHLYVVYFVLPTTGISWLQFEAEQAAILALSLYASTYIAEAVRAAIQAVPKGQIEAALAFAFTRWQTIYYVILPQAMKLIIAPMGGIYVMVIKGSSIVSVIGITELIRAGDLAGQRLPQELMLIYFLVALLYFVYCYPFLWLARFIEHRSSRSIGIN